MRLKIRTSSNIQTLASRNRIKKSTGITGWSGNEAKSQSVNMILACLRQKKNLTVASLRFES